MELLVRVISFVIMAAIPTAIGVVLFVLDRKGKFKGKVSRILARVVMAWMALAVVVSLIACATVSIDSAEPQPESPPVVEEATEETLVQDGLEVGQSAVFSDYTLNVASVESDGATLAARVRVTALHEIDLSGGRFSAGGDEEEAVDPSASELDLSKRLSAGESVEGTITFADNGLTTIAWQEGQRHASWRFAATEPQPQATGVLKAHFIEVGQGDSAFYEMPDGKTMLVDAGTSSAGQTVVSYVRDLGYEKIDYVVATHPHEDHIGGMSAVLSAFQIGEVWAPPATHDTQTFEDFLNAVAAKGLSIRTATAGKVMCEDAGSGFRVDILSPADGANPGDLNDWSVIQKLTFGDTSFLLTGDAGSSLISGAAAGHVDVLKVGHHGSETSTDASLASSLTPQISVISCGAGNDYGHPDQSALDALATSTVYRTDLNGTVVVESDGTTVTATPARAADPAAIAKGPETLEAEAAAAQAAAEAEQAAPAASDSSSMTVYITNTGSKYHLDGCRHLKKSKIPTTLGEAKAAGYEPCGTCDPPA